MSSNASIGSTASGSTNTIATDAMEEEDTAGITAIFDYLTGAVLDPRTDKLRFFSTILRLPAKSTTANGWWAGMNMVKDDQGRQICRRCQKTLEEVAADKGHADAKTPYAKVNDMRRHVFDCEAEHVHSAAVPDLVALFDQYQTCPVCRVSMRARREVLLAAAAAEQAATAAIGSDDSPHSPLQAVNVDNEIQVDATGIEPLDEEEIQTRTVLARRKHLFEVHESGETCICGYVLEVDEKKRMMHFATHHRLWASQKGMKTVPRDSPLCNCHFPDVHFSLER